MLTRLYVQNYVLIDELDIPFGKGLSIITGETGAGKSIILGALSLMLGQRADTGLLLNKQKKCIVEGTFLISGYGLHGFFAENGLDYEDETILRREISAEGKSRAFINDTPVNLNVLKELATSLVDIHSQHENLLLGSGKFQLKVVDSFAANQACKDQYKALYNRFTDLTQSIVQLQEEEIRIAGESDYLRFQYDELSQHQLQDGEQDELEQEQEKLTHADEILRQLDAATAALHTDEDNVTGKLQKITTAISALSRFDEHFSSQAHRLQAVNIELKDIYSELEHAARTMHADPARLSVVQERLNVIYALQNKHRLKSISELLKLRDELKDKLEKTFFVSDELSRLRAELTRLKPQLASAASELRLSRTKAIPSIEKEISKQLSGLAMPHAVLRIAMIESEQGVYHPDGTELIRFMFSANKGGDFKELSKVASGGEISRLMLCIKALMARSASLPTVILDEIDTGISGETAARVGVILQQMSAEHQVITITHLPQIASKGHSHYLVVKEVKKNQTRSYLKKLNDEERLNEIARMLSGEALTEAALENARNLLHS